MIFVSTKFEANLTIYGKVTRDAFIRISASCCSRQSGAFSRVKQKYRGHFDEAARSQPPSTSSFLITATTGKKGSPEERHELQLAPRRQKNSIILDSPSYSFLLRKRGELGRNKRNTKNGERSIFKGLFFQIRATVAQPRQNPTTRSRRNPWKINPTTAFSFCLSLSKRASYSYSFFSFYPSFSYLTEIFLNSSETEFVSQTPFAVCHSRHRTATKEKVRAEKYRVGLAATWRPESFGKIKVSVVQSGDRPRYNNFGELSLLPHLSLYIFFFSLVPELYVFPLLRLRVSSDPK